MPLPAGIAAALVSSGSNILSQGINAFSTGKMNKKTRKWNEKMYSRQREDALSDYAMQNEYNHPSNQMARLREANLNPNLIYGGSTGIMEASNVRAAEKGNWNPEAPQVQLGAAAGAGISAYYDTQVKEAQTDLLRSQNTLAMENQKLVQQQRNLLVPKEAEAWNKVRSMDFDIAQKYETRLESQDMVREGLRKLRADINYTNNQDRRSETMNQAAVSEIGARITSMMFQNAKSRTETAMIQEQINNLEKDGTLKQLEIEMRKKGMTFNDPAWQRQISEAWNNPQKLTKVIKGFLERFRNN